MTIRHSCIFLLIIFSLSCKNEAEEKNSYPVVDSSALVINFDQKNASKKTLDEIIEIKEIIPLETSNNFYIWDINKCIRTDSTLIVLDSKFSKLLLYSIKGSFIREIGKLGNGAGEFENISGFFIDKKANINIYSSESMKIVTFDKLGRFLSEKNVPFYAQNVVKINDNKYAFYIDYNNSVNTKNHNLVITDSLLNVKKYFFKYPKNPNGPTLGKMSGGIFQSSKESSFYYGAFQDSIFEITDNKNNVSLKYVINFHDNIVPNEIKADPSNSLKTNASRVSKFNQLFGVVYQTDSLLTFSYLEKRIPQKAVFFKPNKLLLKNSNISGYTKYLGKTIGVYGNSFISCISADTYKRTIINNPEVEKYMIKKEPVLHKYLSKMYKNEENPVLIFWGQKKH